MLTIVALFCYCQHFCCCCRYDSKVTLLFVLHNRSVAEENIVQALKLVGKGRDLTSSFSSDQSASMQSELSSPSGGADVIRDPPVMSLMDTYFLEERVGGGASTSKPAVKENVSLQREWSPVYVAALTASNGTEAGNTELQPCGNGCYVSQSRGNLVLNLKSMSESSLQETKVELSARLGPLTLAVDQLRWRNKRGSQTTCSLMQAPLKLGSSWTSALNGGGELTLSFQMFFGDSTRHVNDEKMYTLVWLEVQEDFAVTIVRALDPSSREGGGATESDSLVLWRRWD